MPMRAFGRAATVCCNYARSLERWLGCASGRVGRWCLVAVVGVGLVAGFAAIAVARPSHGRRPVHSDRSMALVRAFSRQRGTREDPRLRTATSRTYIARSGLRE